MSEAVSEDMTPPGTPQTLARYWEEQRNQTIAVVSLTAALIVAVFHRSFMDIFHNWNLPDSLYSHAMLIPCISLFFVWRLREKVVSMEITHSRWGYVSMTCGCILLVLGDFLDSMSLIHLALLPVLSGLSLVYFGRSITKVLWFPLAFLFFMIPMPYSFTSAISFQSKMLATESAVLIGKTLTLHMVQDGSYVYLGAEDRLLVGDVCGGMRSLVALLAFGALMAYVSKARWWAKMLILLVSPLIAIFANVTRIFFLCVVGYIFGDEVATGWVHDVSGIGIFAVAFVLLFTVEAILRRIAPERKHAGAES